MSGGRPSDYTPEIATEICAQIAEGKSLRTICRAESKPSLQAVFNWLAKYPEFVDQYARAREQQADALAEEILDISDDAQNDYMERLGEEGQSIGWQLNGEHVQRSRLRVDSRKWLASKLKPKKYGEKLEVAGDQDNPIRHERIVRIIIEDRERLGDTDCPRLPAPN